MHVSSVTCAVKALNSLHDHDLRAIEAMLTEWAELAKVPGA